MYKLNRKVNVYKKNKGKEKEKRDRIVKYIIESKYFFFKLRFFFLKFLKFACRPGLSPWGDDFLSEPECSTAYFKI